MARPLVDWLLRWSEARPTPSQPLAVAFSGGLDSTALLHVSHALFPGAVVALHVNHGLQPAAPDFEDHCAHVCADLGIPLLKQSVAISLQRGDSVEERARECRYQALAELAQRVNARAVWLAQHADDQVETFLLALSRGSGVAGLAGMGEHAIVRRVVFGRPWLSIRQDSLRDRVTECQWPYLDDPTNVDIRFTRNHIRHNVLPGLSGAFPSMKKAIMRSARHCAQASELLNDLAQQDMVQLGWPPRLDALQALSPARQANALRCWLVSEAGRAPSTAQLDELRKQLTAATTRGHRICIKVADGTVVRSGAFLSYVPAEGA